MTTKFQRLGNVFGSALPALDITCFPKRVDVVRHWISLVDARASRQLSFDQKAQVKSEVISAVVSIWESKGTKVCDDKNLGIRYDRLISAADKLGQNPYCKKNDRVWIEKEFKSGRYDTIFDIGEASSASNSAPTTPLKRKSQEMVRFLQPST